MLRDRFREVSDQAARQRAKAEAVIKRRQEEAPLILSIEDQRRREEEEAIRRADAEAKAAPVRARISHLENQKQTLEQLRSELEAGYKEAGQALAEFKTVSQQIETEWQAHQEDLETHVGIKDKAGVIKHPEFQEEEDVIAYKAKGRKTREAVKRLRAARHGFKEAMPDLTFRGGRTKAEKLSDKSSPREQAFMAIAAKIREIENTVAELKKELPEWQELQAKRQAELPKLEARHNKENSGFDPYDRTDYHQHRHLVLEEDVALAPQLGEEWVEASIKSHYDKAVDAKVAEKMRAQGLDEVEKDLNRLDNLDTEITEAEKAISAMKGAYGRLQTVLEQSFGNKELAKKFIGDYRVDLGGKNDARDLANYCLESIMPKRLERSGFRSFRDYYGVGSDQGYQNVLETQKRELDSMRAKGGIIYSQVINPQHIIAGMRKIESLLAELSETISSNPADILKGLYLDGVKLDPTLPPEAEAKTIGRHSKTTEWLREESIGGALKKLRAEQEALKAEGEKVKGVVNARIDAEWSRVMEVRFEMVEHPEYYQLAKKQETIAQERQLAARMPEQLNSSQEQFKDRLGEELTIEKQTARHAPHSRYPDWELKSVPLEAAIEKLNKQITEAGRRGREVADKMRAKRQAKPGAFRALLGAQKAYDDALNALQTQKNQAETAHRTAVQALETKGQEQEALAPLRTLANTLNFGAKFAGQGKLTIAQLLEQAGPYFQAIEARRLPPEEEEIVVTQAALREKMETAKENFEKEIKKL